MKTWLQRLVMALIFVLISEGLVRKLLPGGLSTLYILVKDGLTFLILLMLLRCPLQGRAAKFLFAWIVLGILLVPLVITTALHDPLLAIFGTKQYLLFEAVTLGLLAGFSQTAPLEGTRPYRWMTLALYPIVALSLMQLFLPTTHWLNLSVAGEDLSAFSAGGRLRVSGPFPFVAQYSWFLHVAIYAVTISFVLWPALKKPWSWLLHPLPVLVLLVIANVISGSRLSAIGSGLILVLGICLVSVRGRGRSLREIAAVLVVGAVALFVARTLAPAAFQAFEARSQYFIEEGEVGAEYVDRADHAFLGWIYLYEHYQPGFFGYGLGVMSNGVDSFSGYARQIRSKVWGEADLANTVLEGGYYLVAVWMGFRLYVIVLCLRAFFRLRHSKLIFAGSLVMGSVIFNGLFSTLGIQPPLAIWWFLSVGTILLLEQQEAYWRARAQEQKRRESPLETEAAAV
ncbi:MAG: hypothetical protein E1N59_1797 [Puniceicoccaceae bacterium 5H]|nr:MAG: hypothetical protein E1N59_1797 [Puniceicoccaceae bacterium 5H]